MRTFAQLHDAISGMSAGWEGIGRVFRGQSAAEWKLVPKAGRPPYTHANLAVYFSEWKRHALGFVPARLDSDWEWLALAQHHGLATNLLDWTYNPLAAAFFAVAEDRDCDAVILSYRPDSLALTSHSHPFAADGIVVYKPFHVGPRISRQMGVFTVHNPPSLALEDPPGEAAKLEAVVVEGSYRRQLLFDLASYGINHATLFPDLDGLSAHMNWKMLHDVLPNSL